MTDRAEAIERALLESLRFAGHMNGCNWAKGRCACGYLTWRDARSDALSMSSPPAAPATPATDDEVRGPPCACGSVWNIDEDGCCQGCGIDWNYELALWSVSKWSRMVSAPELASMLIMSFRYALGRQSTAPSAVADLLRQYGDILQPWQREQIVRDIEHAIECGVAGADCDVVTWREVMDRIDREDRKAPGDARKGEP